MKIRESYGSRRYEEEYRAALEKSVHYFRQNSCITELRKMGYAQTKLQVEYEAEEYGKSEICCLDAETNTFLIQNLQKNLLQKMIFRSVKM